MTSLRWYPTRAIDRAVYHDDAGCPEGAAIERQYRRPGTGGRPPCERCAAVEAELAETRERYCPACRSGKVTPVSHVRAANGWIKVEHRCEACGVAFFFVRKPVI